MGQRYIFDIRATYVKSSLAGATQTQSRDEERRCGENCRASHSLFPKMFKRSAPERGRKRS